MSREVSGDCDVWILGVGVEIEVAVVRVRDEIGRKPHCLTHCVGDTSLCYSPQAFLVVARRGQSPTGASGVTPALTPGREATGNP